MSFPVERTDQLLRFETGLAVSQAMMAANALGLGQSLIAFGRKPGGIEGVFGLPTHDKLTWAHVIGYPLEDRKAGGQRPRLKFVPDPEVNELLRAKGMLQEQAPLPSRMEELDALAERFGRDPGTVTWPAREIQRLMNDDWDVGPRIREHAQKLIDKGGLPEYPEAMRETFERLMNEHGLDTSKCLS